MKNKYYLQIGTVVVLLIVLFFLWPHLKKAKAPVVVTDFASCAEVQGGVADETSPRTCTYNGQVYTENQNQAEVIVDSPKVGDLVTSPLKISGKARGSWFFEANMPAVLKDSNGKVLVQKGLTATGDWMTTDFVPFAGTLEFATPTTDYGLLIISKDNPSGDPANDKTFVVPVKFR